MSDEQKIVIAICAVPFIFIGMVYIVLKIMDKYFREDPHKKDWDKK